MEFERIRKEMDEKAEEYLEQLQSSTEMEKVFRAQGALEMYRFFQSIPERIKFEEELDKNEAE